MRLKYLEHYEPALKTQVSALIKSKKLPKFLHNKYPNTHNITNDKALYNYTLKIKNSYLKKSAPLSRVIYDGKIHVINNALGLHTFASRVQGSKLKSKNEIRVATLFKEVPEPFLEMIIVHELAHLKEKEHNKAFYKLCTHMLPNYHQLEFDTRLYLTCLDHFGKIYHKDTHN